jgi:hypothetical protein
LQKIPKQTDDQGLEKEPEQKDLFSSETEHFPVNIEVKTAEVYDSYASFKKPDSARKEVNSNVKQENSPAGNE